MEDCFNGKHKLVDIYTARHSWDESHEIVRWCPICGAIVVDVEYDGRVKPGDTMTMKFPETFKEKFEEHKKRESEMSTCSKCGVKTPFVMTLDNWAIIDGEDYCRNCQKKHKVGWYEPKTLDDEN